MSSWLGNARAALATKLRSEASSGSGAADPVFAVDVLSACSLAGVDNGDSLGPVRDMIFDPAHPLAALTGAPASTHGGATAGPVGSWAAFAAVDSNAVSVPTRRALVDLASLDYAAAATLVRQSHWWFMGTRGHLPDGSAVFAQHSALCVGVATTDARPAVAS